MAKRRFDEMVVVAAGSQTFQERFTPSRGERHFSLDTPKISQWRCNLTGLSQVHNLYFVGYGQSIYVYTPRYPSQIIAEQPSLTITSQPSSPRLNGYIDRRHPHAINNLIVQLFGTEEVIAVVRDDGDVDAFLTRHIVQAIEIRKEPRSTIGVEGDEVRPFFQSNVGISAWGLAIHSEARILATSSNAHEVRVFKFGLLQTASPTVDPDKDERQTLYQENDASSPDVDYQRKTDVTHQVINGETNIPYISFCNTGDDPEARWLLTTDISGVCRVMDLHSLEAVQAFRFGRSFATAHTGGFDRLNAGWAIMFLDRRSFRAEFDVRDALGVDEHVESTTPKVYRDGEVWDLSNTARRLEEYSEPFMLHQLQTGERSTHVQTTVQDSLDGLSSDPNSPHLEYDMAVDESVESPGWSDDEGVDVDMDIDAQDEPDEDEDEGGGVEVETTERPAHDSGRNRGDVDEEYLTAQEDGYDDSDEVMEDSSRASEPDREPEPNERLRAVLVDDNNDPDDEGTEDTMSYASFYNGESIVGNDPRYVRPLAPLCNGIPCPILHASVRNVYLLQPPNKKQPSDSPTAFHPPMLGLANPLKQPIHQDFQYLRVFERLNMSTSIPSLGLVIIASQKGRAMVLALTKITRSTSYASALKDFDLGNRSIYSMKLRAILPFAWQERQSKRSCYPLHGIAVSPVQGSEGSKSGRWRLMMMYQDHSILSYELSRKSRARDSGVDIGAVVV